MIPLHPKEVTPDMVNDQSWHNRWRENAKSAVRGVAQRGDVAIGRGVFANQVGRTLAAKQITTVLDVGANVGQYARSLRRAGFKGRIISVEPLAGAFSELERHASGDANWLTVNAAVGREVGTLEINVSKNSYSSSALAITDAHLSGDPTSMYVDVQQARMTTVLELLAEHDVDPAATLLKIDTQGFETEVLAGAGASAGEFAALQLEISFVELYGGQELAESIIERLRSWNYRLQTLEPGFSDAEGRLLQCDLLVISEPSERFADVWEK